MGKARDLAERGMEIFHQGNLDELEDVIAWDAEFTMPGVALKGPAQLRQLLDGYRTAFPDINHTVVNTVESGDQFAWEIEVAGTHTGPMVTPAGEIAPTGKKVVWKSVDVIGTADGKVTSWHVYFDQVAVLAQLGVLPEPASA